jgi:hemolysin III
MTNGFERDDLGVLCRMAGGLGVGVGDAVVAPPRWRGRLHQAGFFLALPAGVVLIGSSRGGAARVAAALFVLSLLALFGASATYHVGNWAPAVKARLQRLDHAMIFVLIAGSYTPITLLALEPAWGITFLVLAWTIAVGGAILALWHIDTVHRFAVYIYIGFGWLLVLALPAVLDALTTTELALLLAGGILYTVGAVGLWLRRPDPSPTIFGYHEVWHALTLVAAGCHYALVLMLVG